MKLLCRSNVHRPWTNTVHVRRSTEQKRARRVSRIVGLFGKGQERTNNQRTNEPTNCPLVYRFLFCAGGLNCFYVYGRNLWHRVVPPSVCQSFLEKKRIWCELDNNFRFILLLPQFFRDFCNYSQYVIFQITN